MFRLPSRSASLLGRGLRSTKCSLGSAHFLKKKCHGQYPGAHRYLYRYGKKKQDHKGHTKGKHDDSTIKRIVEGLFLFAGGQVIESFASSKREERLKACMAHHKESLEKSHQKKYEELEGRITKLELTQGRGGSTVWAWVLSFFS